MFGGSSSSLEELRHEIFKMIEYTFQVFTIGTTIYGNCSSRVEKLINWTAPLKNWIKINTDGTSWGSTEMACAGVIGRDSNDLQICYDPFCVCLDSFSNDSLDLRRNIENLEKNSVTSLRTLVNIGSEVYLQADVPDTQCIFVDIGLGFHVEFTWSEALNYISQREEKLARQIEEYTRLIASIKAQIKLVCEGIRELLELPAEKPLPERIF
ncbi:uncharacterized protein LOC110823972 [Carica papaya]|uniref:uncharacterized protein LOC110823972 n=1 Tax=Carica papaya TaxID=3649 RepID=UPI000B8CEA88|nr:uncharacterized protein LOC110823972 [Carica papaya]